MELVSSFSYESPEYQLPLVHAMFRQGLVCTCWKTSQDLWDWCERVQKIFVNRGIFNIHISDKSWDLHSSSSSSLSSSLPWHQFQQHCPTQPNHPHPWAFESRIEEAERTAKEVERLVNFWKQEAVKCHNFVIQDLINMEGSRVKIKKLERELRVSRAENSQLKKDNDEVWKMMEELEEESQWAKDHKSRRKSQGAT